CPKRRRVWTDPDLMAGVTVETSTGSRRQRAFELTAILTITVMLTLISRLETRLYELSTQLAKDDSFVASIFFYAIINLNVFLAILLSFLVVRNIAKLVVERRRGVFGSQLRTKLVATLMVFALTPTVIVFYVSTRSINESFDEWFGGRFRDAMQQARESGSQIYLQDQRRLEGIARVAASKVKVRNSAPFLRKSPAIEVVLDGFELEYGVYSVRVFDRDSILVWSSIRDESASTTSLSDRHLTGRILGRFATRMGLVSSSIVGSDDRKDIVRAAVPLRSPDSGELSGIVVVEERFDMPFLRSLESIMDAFSRLRPAAQLVRVSYLIWVTVMTLMIIFGAVWFGFRVARTIIGPLQILAEATKEVALGNYAITIVPQSDDETGQLTRAFNTMTSDLERHRQTARDAQARLEINIQELERRRRYMEIVFANIAAGVVAVDAKGNVTAFNTAAVNMLGLSSIEGLVGRPIAEVLGPVLWSVFWDEAMVSWHEKNLIVTKHVDLRPAGIDLALFVAMTGLRNEDGEELGAVVVFDDATQRAKQQRLMAWREVASRIAHEIKNPITPIKLSAERLLRRFSHRFNGEDQEVFESCTKSILVQVDFLKDLVNEFGKFAKLPTIRPQPVSLSEAVSKAIDVFRLSYPMITFEMEVFDELPVAMIDVEQMHRAFINLLGNSVEAINQGKNAGVGIISASLRHESKTSRFVIEIKDNGPGIPSEIKDRVFDPYVSAKALGTGLGLAITSQIIAEHGGLVRILQTGHGGTIMRIELPSVDLQHVPEAFHT
ncbi:MAG: ATP-binding protein, partial [Proteobacteria bacterium]|nr:ATP-binding protein [Pseudomonadota bacterium]